MKAFLSYTRSDANHAAAVADDIRLLGHTIWYDREVTAGQAWWAAILRQIRECDLFLFILTPRSLESQACRAEYTYASQLQKRVLPVLCANGVKDSLLPPELSIIQYVDYRSQDKKAAFDMAKALCDEPAAAPLPIPLPPEPPTPISYLGDLRAQIESSRELDLAEQRTLFYEVKRRLKDQESHDDALDLLQMFRARDDLRASVADEINSILDHGPKKPRWKAAEDHPLVPRSSESGAPATAIDLGGDLTVLEDLTRAVVTGSDSWVLTAGKDRLCMSEEKGMLVLAATFVRWTGKELKGFKALGWSLAGDGMQKVVTAALGALGIATYGLAFGALMHKGTRDYLNRTTVVKQFALTQETQAAVAIVQAFGILAPGATTIIASKAEKNELQPAVST
jgi:hypothetical protein